MKKFAPLFILGIFLTAVILMVISMKNASTIVHPSYKSK